MADITQEDGVTKAYLASGFTLLNGDVTVPRGVTSTADPVASGGLETSLISDMGDPTFTRATTATVTDFEGLVKTVKSGEARFQGARRVENLLTYSQDFTNAVWANFRSTDSADAETAPDGTLTADKLIQGSGETTTGGLQATGVSFDTASYTYSVYAKAAGYDGVILRKITGTPSGIVAFDLASGVVSRETMTNTGTSITAVGDGWYRCSVTIAAVAASDSISIQVSNAAGDETGLTAGDGVNGIYIWGAQLENVQGQSTQTVSEYVSTDVLSAPYHGANVDGVKYFDTMPSGAPINTSNSKYAVLPGNSGDYFSTPDSVANSITGDIDIRVMAALDDWTPADKQTLVSKFESPNNQGYILSIEPTGEVRLLLSQNGFTNAQAISTVATGFSAGTAHWVRGAWSAADGEATFYTSEDGETWTQLGSVVALAVASTFNSASNVKIGAHEPGGTAKNATAKVYRAQIYNGISGTLAVDFNPNNSDGTSPWNSSTTGEAWTANGNTSIYVGEWDATGPKGYLAEGQRENLILNSDVMVTQNITTTAAERTLSFYGTGTVTLSGTSTAGPLVGTGANDRVELTYTPTAGTLTLTVSGTVTNAQDELGAFASSWIPTVATAVTRNADQLSYPTAGNFSDTTGTAYAEVEATDWANAAGQILGDGTEAPLIASSQKAGDLPGSAGDYFSTPDSVANSITGDIDLRFIGALDDWTPAATNTMIAKREAFGNRSFAFFVPTTSLPTLSVYEIGEAVTFSYVADAVLPVVDGQTLGVRAALDVDNGAGDSDCTFYTSTDSGETWQQLGSVISRGSPISIFDSSASVEVGATNSGGNQLSGKVYRAQIYNGINGTLAVNFNVNDSDGTSPWNSIATGEAWTANGNASIVSEDAALIKSYDGTNTAVGPYTTDSALEKVAGTWNGGLIAYQDDTEGVTASYDGAFNLAQLNVGQSGFYGTIRNLKLWDRVITQEQLDSL